LTAEDCLPEISRVLSVLASHGDEAPTEVEAAWRAGMHTLGWGERGDMPKLSNWGASLDSDLPKLDRINALQKEQLVKALLATVVHDKLYKPVELELLRIICGLIHVPLPLLTGDIRAGVTGT
ncbi:MAG: hypothetical protein ACREDU_09040, partial [Methylocella sp.]